MEKKKQPQMATINNSDHSEVKNLHLLSKTELVVVLQQLKTKQDILNSEEQNEEVSKTLASSWLGVGLYGIGILILIFGITWVIGILIHHIFTSFMLLGLFLMIFGFFMINFPPYKLFERVIKQFKIFKGKI